MTGVPPSAGVSVAEVFRGCWNFPLFWRESLDLPGMSTVVRQCVCVCALHEFETTQNATEYSYYT